MPTLKVHLKSAKGLKAADRSLLGSSSDPFVKLQCAGITQQSRVIKKNLNPVWNETFQFQVKDPSRDILNCVVYDKDMISSDPIGHGHTTLSTLLRGVATPVKIALKSKGTVNLVLTAVDFGLQAQVQQQYMPQQGYPQQPMHPQGYPQQRPMQPGYPQQPMQPQGYPQQRPMQPQGYPQQPMQPQGYPQQRPMQPQYPQQPQMHPQGYPQQRPMQPQGYPQQPPMHPQGYPQQPPMHPQGYPQQPQMHPQGYPQQRPMHGPQIYTQFPVGKPFVLRSKHSGKCLARKGGHKKGDKVIQADHHHGSSDTVFYFQNGCLVNNGMALTAKDEKVKFKPIKSKPKQFWTYLSDGKIQNQKTGKVLDIDGASKSAGAKVILWKAGSHQWQKWTIESP